MPVVINGSTGISGTDGSASTPAVQGTDTNTGIYFPGADRIGFTEGGTQVGEFDASGNFLFNSGYGSVATAYGCRAWVNFNGTGTVAIRASGNVSSISDNGVGDFTINMSTGMPDANYAANVNIGFTSPADYMLTPQFAQDSAYNEVAPTTTAIRYVLWNRTTGAQRDAKYNFVSIFR
jgi:hypothetical protein